MWNHRYNIYCVHIHRNAHYMAHAPATVAGSSAWVPLVLGGTGRLETAQGGTNLLTEIYDDTGREWLEYEVMEREGWNAGFGCLVQYNDDIYSIRAEEIAVLHTLTWTFDTLQAPIPDFLTPVTKCAVTDIGGVEGKKFFLDGKNWSSLVPLTYEKVSCCEMDTGSTWTAWNGK